MIKGVIGSRSTAASGLGFGGQSVCSWAAYVGSRVGSIPFAEPGKLYSLPMTSLQWARPIVCAPAELNKVDPF